MPASRIPIIVVCERGAFAGLPNVAPPSSIFGFFCFNSHANGSIATDDSGSDDSGSDGSALGLVGNRVDESADVADLDANRIPWLEKHRRVPPEADAAGRSGADHIAGAQRVHG